MVVALMESRAVLAANLEQRLPMATKTNQWPIPIANIAAYSIFFSFLLFIIDIFSPNDLSQIPTT